MGGCKLFVSEELMVAQGDVKDVGKKVKSPVIEFNQTTFKVYLSCPKAPRLPEAITRSQLGVVPMHTPLSPLLHPFNLPTSKSMQALGGASTKDDNANCTHCHIFWPPREPQVLGASIPLKLTVMWSIAKGDASVVKR